VLLYFASISRRTFQSMKVVGLYSIFLFLQIQDILMIQPLKVLVMSVLVALFIKKLEKQELNRMGEEIDNLKSWFTTPIEQHVDDLKKIKTNLFDRANTDHLLPPDNKDLSKMRKYAYRQRQMRAIVKECMYYIVYAAVISLLGFSLRDYNAFMQTRNLENMFKITEVKKGLTEFEKVRFPKARLFL